ncbi:MAG: hypothetical protein J0I10_06285 [Verrucomicrobia bacterium]|nr:hypothetical protein [Verrucomicrobiota bacterium]
MKKPLSGCGLREGGNTRLRWRGATLRRKIACARRGGDTGAARGAWRRFLLPGGARGAIVRFHRGLFDREKIRLTVESQGNGPRRYRTHALQIAPGIVANESTASAPYLVFPPPLPVRLDHGPRRPARGG